jgi:hypothetical protein
LHLVPIPFSGTLADYYTIGEFTNTDYPNLVPPGQRVDTLAVPTVLAVYNWPKGSERYLKVERFVTRLFQNWEKLRNPPYHPKWRDVNPAATVPGWKKFIVAEEQVAKLMANNVQSRSDNQQEFDAFMIGRQAAGRSRKPSSQAEEDALFQEFLQWRQHKGAQTH